VRQFQSEVAAVLARSPAAKPAFRAEEAREGDETVVPVMVARNGESVRVLLALTGGESVLVWFN
jgi:hypothetical protein